MTIDVLANDSDPEGNALTITEVGVPNNGTAAITNDRVVYTPNTDFHGDDSFSYTISDGVHSVSAMIHVTVNGIPLAADDSFTVPQNVATVVDVLANDSDPDNHRLTITAAGIPANGQTSVADNAITYTPNSDYRGADSFTYTVSDSFDTTTATVTITVNGAPVAVDDTATTDQETAVLIPVLANDSDPEGDPLTIQSLSPAGNGTLAVVDDQIQYTPDDAFSGADSFNYTIADGYQEVTASVSVTVNNLNDPPQATDDNATTDEDVAVSIPVLANDSDPDNDPLTITAVGPAANGTVTIDGSTITYTPNANYNGVDSFAYTISDGQATATANVTVFINAVNDDPPVAVDDSGATTENTSVNIDVLSNDYDPDNDAIAIDSVGPAGNGSTSFLQGGSSVLYVPNAGFTGTDSFSYTITDGSATATATVTVTVNPASSNASIPTSLILVRVAPTS